ncbi:uncharacterized protein LOC129316196 [Prosopis cineraria]|uniref:uncharacterized protein LOC129316196 n=1 Tax=Prosopis cineraria TaxID=364024 RepID=UPI00240F3141|nr:uncharacterized protein LOC129316196 [Prosopis cineraria]
MTVAEWWASYGSSSPNLQHLAIRILSLTCSASGCERNWSVFEQIHTKKWNKLAQDRLNDLVFVKYNQALKNRYDRQDVDPISLADIDESNEWLLGSMMGVDEDAADERVFGDDENEELTWGLLHQQQVLENQLNKQEAKAKLKEKKLAHLELKENNRLPTLRNLQILIQMS